MKRRPHFRVFAMEAASGWCWLERAAPASSPLRCRWFGGRSCGAGLVIAPHCLLGAIVVGSAAGLEREVPASSPGCTSSSACWPLHAPPKTKGGAMAFSSSLGLFLGLSGTWVMQISCCDGEPHLLERGSGTSSNGRERGDSIEAGMTSSGVGLCGSSTHPSIRAAKRRNKGRIISGAHPWMWCRPSLLLLLPVLFL